jgi:dihydrofolate reductase
VSADLVLVAAVARNGAIGAIGGANELPWRLPTDLKHFKAITLGKPLIMGRKTFESIGRPLPGRETIVVTRDSAFQAPAGVHVAASPREALELGRARAHAMGANEVILAGGAQLFAALLGETRRLRLTEVDLEPVADAFFPALDWSDWVEISRETPPRAAGDDANCAFVIHERKRRR